MNDVIYRQALRDAMYHEAFEVDSDMQKWDSGCWIRYKLFENVIDKIPSVDAVEVVRCEDCKHFDGECCDRYADETLGYSHSTQPNFFCACGERKNDDS